MDSIRVCCRYPDLDSSCKGQRCCLRERVLSHFPSPVGFILSASSIETVYKAPSRCALGSLDYHCETLLLSDQHTGSLAQKIIKDPSHPLHTVFEWLPSKRRLRCPCCKTQRRRSSFVPRAVLLLNSQCR
uniref:Uncharacterized protein n=1 Tax=Nothobranchius kadleci TaxID=1051664 RepID=A0A1A8E6K6_NOTKA